jgi:hypothetical protein
MGIDDGRVRASVDVGALKGHCWLPVTSDEHHMVL